MSVLDILSDAVRGSGPETSDTKYENALAHLLAFDVSRTSYFDVYIGSKIISNSSQKKDYLDTRFVCHSAELPGESLGFVQQKIYGVVEKFPTMASYNDINLGFYTHGSGIELTRNYFLGWMTDITGRYEQKLSPSGSPAGPTTYNLKYKDQYVRDIYIAQYASTGEPLIRVKLIDAFPIAINQNSLSWTDQNSAMSLSVTFAYTEYEYMFSQVENNGDYSRGGLDPFITAGIKGVAAINTIKGAIESNNPQAIASILPNIGLSGFTVSSITGKIGL